MKKKLGEFSLTTGSGAVHQTEVVGVVGSNGTGKSTLLNIATGFLTAEEGAVILNGDNMSHKGKHRKFRRRRKTGSRKRLARKLNRKK